MNFDYSETQKMVAEAARNFALQYIKPHVMDWDERQFFPVDVFKKAGELGFMGVLVPESYGGSGSVSYTHLTLPTIYAV